MTEQEQPNEEPRPEDEPDKEAVEHLSHEDIPEKPDDATEYEPGEVGEDHTPNEEQRGRHERTPEEESGE